MWLMVGGGAPHSPLWMISSMCRKFLHGITLQASPGGGEVTMLVSKLGTEEPGPSSFLYRGCKLPTENTHSIPQGLAAW